MGRSVLVMILALSSGAVAFAAGGVSELPAEARQVLVETQGTDALTAPSTPVVTAAPVETAAESEAKPVLAESQIPLKLDEKKSSAEGPGPFSRMLMGFAVLAILAGGGYFVVRRYGKPGPRKNAPQIKILTQHWLGPKKSLAIVRVAGESILIGVTDQNISMIKSLALLDEEIPVETPDRFQSAMEKAALPEHEIQEDGEDFQMTGLNQIRDVVSKRLKNMRSIN